MEAIALNKVQEFTKNLNLESNYSNVRTSAANALENMDFPTTRVEDWKYTRVAKLSKMSLETNNVSINDVSEFVVPHLDTNLLVFVNGYFQENVSSYNSDECTIGLTSQTDVEELGSQLDANQNVFTALNTAYFTDGFVVKVAKNKVVSKPIQILNLSKGENVISNTRNVIVLEQSAEANLILNSASLDNGVNLNNGVTEVVVKENAKVNITKIQNESEHTYNINSEAVYQEKNSVFTMTTVTVGGQLVRNNPIIKVDGENCETNIYGAFIPKGKAHFDNHTVVDHLKSNCESNELYKGILDDQSTGVFNGKVYVRENAQKINAYQSNGNVVLTDTAKINSKPELEIYADDVKCSHGCTIGQLDEDALFYLRARGLGEASAKNLLVSAFVSDTLDLVKHDEVVEYIESIFNKKFGW